MIDNDPGKSIRSIARYMRVSKFLIRQLVHGDKRKDSAAELFNKLKDPFEWNIL